MEITQVCKCASVFVIIILVLPLEVLATPDDEEIKSYIVYMDKSRKPHHFSLHQHWYASMIERVSGSKSDPTAMVYMYDTVMHGFCAKLSSTGAQAMLNMDGCLAVLPDSVGRLHTTRTPDFLGLSFTDGLWPVSHYGDNVIVGLLDSGIWPESKSFSDEGLSSQLPEKWKGECEVGSDFNASHCNNKLIGARYFVKGYEAKYGPVHGKEDYRSPRDSYGHGTHTSSTAAGSEVPGASFLGFAGGTARGIATKARLAVYKVCWELDIIDRGDCVNSDVLAGMEAAVSDGVDVLSISLGIVSGAAYYDDILAIGALGATEKGVFVSCSAGNSGPYDIFNTAPWITTVGASTIDRDFPAPVVLGNGKSYMGFALNKDLSLANEQLPLVYGKTASSNENASFCTDGSLHSDMVRGKIVICDLGPNGIIEMWQVVRRAGGAGIILANPDDDGDYSPTSHYPFPATMVGPNAGEHIKAYINTTTYPMATIQLEGLTVVGKARAPVVARFSSRGPNTVVPEILKPDLVAPGVNILAAWTGDVGPTDLASDNGRVDFNIDSGTSMSCPHVAGIAALIRAAHPAWTPAAIKSALMTSSLLLDNRNSPIGDSFTGLSANAFAMGAGHVNPNAALDPGLIYDLGMDDYVRFLCTLNYTAKQIHILTRNATSCPQLRSAPGDLNYPSFSVVFKPSSLVLVTRRTVTNVGGEPCEYEVSVESPENVNITVEPRTLAFGKQNEKATYTVTFESKIAADDKPKGRQAFGQILWKCVKGGTQVVRSPVAIAWNRREE